MRARLSVFISRLLGFLRHRTHEQDFDDEIQTHLHLLIDENIRRGMTPADAMRAARVRLGGLTQLKEHQRDHRGIPLIAELWQDTRYALRVFGKNRGFTLVAILTVAIGVGLNTIVFTLVDAVAFKKLPVADAGNIARVERSFQSGARGDVQYAFSFQEYEYFRTHSQRVASLIAASWPVPVAAALDGYQTLHGQVVSGDYFAALGMSPAIGRSFLAEEDQVRGRDPVIVLSDTCWRRHFHANPDAVGHTVTLNGTAFTIIGVAPATFIGTGNPPQVPDFWAPLMMQGTINAGAAWLDKPDIHRLQLLARVAADTSRGDAAAELHVLQSQLSEHPETHTDGDRTIAIRLQPAVYFGGTDDVRFAASAMLSLVIVSMILVVACANLANMLLARGIARHKEIGMRLALGASRARIVRQLLTESVWLAAAGGLAGLLLSYWGSRLAWNVLDRFVQTMFLTDQALIASVTLDGPILGFTLALSVGTGLLFGLVPALKSSGSDLAHALTQPPSRFGNRVPATRSWLIGGQMALSVAFLICAGLLLRGLARAQSSELGLDSSRVFMVFMSLGSDTHAAPALQQRIVNGLRQSSDIRDIALVDRYPFGGTWTPPVTVEDVSTSSHRRSERMLANYVSSAYFGTMGIAIRRGRTFNEAEQEAASPVAIVSESAARHLWPEADPLGKRLTLDMNFKGQLADFEVIGIAKDVRSANVSRVDPGYVYLPSRSGVVYNVLIRSDRDVTRVSAAINAVVEAIDRRLLPSVRVVKMNDSPFVRVQMALPEILAACVAALALVALTLSGIGIYGVASYAAVQRTREVGIRLALGATAGGVRRLMVRQAMTPMIVGAGIGVPAAAAVSRLLQSTLTMPSTPDFLFGVDALDPLTFAAVTIFALVVAAVASYIPVRRATRADPLSSLRYE
jgi:predicted permease